MTDDDEAARKNRADDLRKQIDSLKHRQNDTGTENGDAVREESESGGGGVSPRDFIHEKMRELDA